LNSEACHPQSAQTAFAARDYAAARYWFELVRTWSPASAAAPLAACEAATAAVGSAATSVTRGTVPTAERLPPAGPQQVAAPPVRTIAGLDFVQHLECANVLLSDNY